MVMAGGMVSTALSKPIEASQAIKRDLTNPKSIAKDTDDLFGNILFTIFLNIITPLFLKTFVLMMFNLDCIPTKIWENQKKKTIKIGKFFWRF